MAEPKGWHSRGYLPHFDGGEVPQMVTFRLADSLPRQRLEAWRDELAHKPQQVAATERIKRIEAYLDQGTGSAWLRDPRIGALVQDALLCFDDSRYRLYAWVIMPNHVHVLLMPSASYALAAIVQSWKSYTAKQANRILQRAGEFWQREYFDRYIRHNRHFAAAVSYIEGNPVSAGLCARPEDWLFGSAHLREDMAETG